MVGVVSGACKVEVVQVVVVKMLFRERGINK